MIPSNEAWWQKPLESLSVWQFRKLNRHRARLRAGLTGHQLLQQVKSLEPQRLEHVRADNHEGIDMREEVLQMGGLPAADAGVQTEQGMDFKIPNWLPYYDPAEQESQVATQTDPCHVAAHGDSDCRVLSNLTAYDWVDELDVLGRAFPSPADSLSPGHSTHDHVSVQTPLEHFDVASQAGTQSYKSTATQSFLSTHTVGVQTDADDRADVLEYGDAMRARRDVAICGCPIVPLPYSSRHKLMTVPVGEVGIVMKVYPDKAMIKVDFPEKGVGFVSYMDTESFDLLLNVHAESDRMMRARQQVCDANSSIGCSAQGIVVHTSSSQSGGCCALREGRLFRNMMR